MSQNHRTSILSTARRIMYGILAGVVTTLGSLGVAGAESTSGAPQMEWVEIGGKRTQVVRITIGPNGYVPGQFTLKAGVPTRLIFTRTTDETCIQQIQIPSFGIKSTPLPLNKPVTISFTPKSKGSYTFICGMNMVKGTIVVQS